MHTTIVIVNYRTAALTVDCLASLAEHVVGRNSINVTVVDNASGDQSLTLLDAAIKSNGWNDWVRLMPLERNGGFAFGNNAAIRAAVEDHATGGQDRESASTDFVWLLNPDTIVRENSLDRLIAFMKDNPKTGIVGSRLEDPDATPQRSAFRFPSLGSEIDDGLRIGFVSRLLSRFVVAPEVSDIAVQTNWVAGASMLVRTAVFRDVGLLDDDYFMYYEETDFCRQASNRGWMCSYEPASRVVHLVGQASGVTVRGVVPKRRPRYWFDSRRRYFIKNHGTIYAAVVDAAWVLCYASWCLRARLQRKASYDPPKLLGDFVRNSVWLRGIAT